jgi:energy-coupling factor transport system ATP-binding protein
LVAAITVENLSFRYPRRSELALRDVQLQIEEGECVLLLGPTGCGKSTLALCLNGLIPQLVGGEMQGHVSIRGRDTRQTPVGELARQVGLVFQDPEAQFCMLTVEDEVAFGLENLGIPAENMDARIAAALALVGLSEQRHTRLDRLSGGMKQRLALAAVLALGARILVLDEPTSNLDPQGTADFFAHLATLKRQGYTIVLVEHKLDELMDLGDPAHPGQGLVDQVVVWSADGRIAATGDPHTVFQQQAGKLLEYGIWLPQVTELAYRLSRAGLPIERFPVNSAEAQQLLLPFTTQGPGTASAVQPNPSSGRHYSIQAVGLEYTYPRGPQVLRGLDLEVQRGELLALVGANGSGKTTLALSLCGILRPTDGQVLLDGADVSRLDGKQLAAQIGYVFQNPEHQFVTASVADELVYGLRLRHRPEEEVQGKVSAMLEQFGLTDQADVNPFKLSQGQKRRLSVATMLILGQEVLILDEPTFGQDRSNAYRLMDEMRRLQQGGCTILFATHDMRLVAEYATRVAVLDEGRIFFDGSPQDLFAHAEALRRAQLRAPALYSLSRAIAAYKPTWPPLATIDEYCAYLGVCCA